MNGQSLGFAPRDGTFYFTVSNRDQNGLAIGILDTDDDPFTPTHFDVIDPEVPDTILIDQTLSQTTDYGNLWFGQIDFSSSIFTADSRDKTYSIVVKEGTGEQDRFHLYGVTVSGTVERLNYLRNDIENVIFPRLKRALGLLGENSILDAFEYDNAHNIVGLRIRIFQNTTSVQLATPDLPDSDVPEVGEIATYRIDQTMELPRSVRLDHTSFADVDEPDVPANENQDTDFETAPGNEAGWPV